MNYRNAELIEWQANGFCYWHSWATFLYVSALRDTQITLLEPSLPAFLLRLLPALCSRAAHRKPSPAGGQAQRADLAVNSPRSRTEDLCLHCSAELTSVGGCELGTQLFCSGDGPRAAANPGASRAQPCATSAARFTRCTSLQQPCYFGLGPLLLWVHCRLRG